MTPPGTPHETGWLAPFWAPELLSGRFFPTARSDQFSLGVVLYLLATRVHPFSTEFCDPDLLCHWILEPADFREKRPDWAEAFHRAANGLSISGDAVILTLSTVIRRMLAWESDHRFRSFGEILETLSSVVPAVWEATLSGNSLPAGSVKDESNRQRRDARLAKNEELPALWRSALRAWETKAPPPMPAAVSITGTAVRGSANSARAAVADNPVRCNRGKVRSVSLTVSCDGVDRLYALIGGDVIRLGRSRQNADLRLRRYPLTAENDRLTRRISAKSPHVSLSRESSGVSVIDHETMNGTWLNGKRVSGAATLDQSRSSILDIGGAIQLSITPFPEGKASDSRSFLRSRSLRLDPLGFETDTKSTIIVYSFAKIGSAEDCEIRVPGLADQGAILLARTEEGFVAHPADEPSRVQILHEGDRIHIGSVSICLGDRARLPLW